MNKKEFQNKFKTLIDGLVDEYPVPYGLGRFAKSFARAPETLQKWYDGAAAPANASREMVIKHLYAEQKKREFAKAVREVIRNELKIGVKQNNHYPMYEGDSVSAEIQLKLGDEVIDTDWITLSTYHG